MSYNTLLSGDLNIMIRSTKTLLTLAVALWGLLGGLGNLASYEEGLQSVQAVLSMETLPEDAIPEGPRVPNPLILHLGFAFIWILKLVGGMLCLVGSVQMWRARNSEQADFAAAKRWGIFGCGVLFFMLFFGFSLVAIGPFKLYLSPLESAVQLAALFAAQIGLVMIFLQQKES
jgi:predicted small integral membrane protein